MVRVEPQYYIPRDMGRKMLWFRETVNSMNCKIYKEIVTIVTSGRIAFNISVAKDFRSA